MAQLNASLTGRYTIDREIGQGGMATVYLARDIKHERKVALKVLNPELGAVLGVERFLSEIRVTANLQHPNLLPLFDSGAAEGHLFYVMPYVEGESLRARLQREKQLPLDEAIHIATAVASALDYAHRHGVIHRDLKPENILLHENQPMVADFGIALAVSNAGGNRITQTGLSLGTPQYMSPEQATGDRTIDGRTDVYSLGAVLYEMLTGEPPHSGTTAQAIIAKVITDKPRNIRLSRDTVPVHVEATVERALAKLPADRFATAHDFQDALLGKAVLMPSGIATPGSAVRPTGAAPRWRQAMASPTPWAAAFAIAVVAAGWGWLRPQPQHVPPPVERFTLTFDRSAQLSDATGSPIAIAPDGSRIVFVGQDSQRVGWLFSRGSERVEPVVIAGTRDAIQPFFSPDGKWIGFLQDGKLRKVSLAGGAVITICEIEGTLFGASWGDGDIIVFSGAGSLHRVAATGGKPENLAIGRDSNQVHRWPEVLPGGRGVVFTIVAPEGPHLASVDLEAGETRRLDQAGMNAHYVDHGYLVFAQGDGTLFSASFDVRRLRFTGPPQPVAENVRLGPASVAKLGISRTGSLAYLSGASSLREVVVVERTGRVQPLRLSPGRYRQPRFSADGRRIVVAIDYDLQFSGDIWLYDGAAQNITRLTFDSVSILPEWMPDGRHVAYVRRFPSGIRGISRIAVDGSGVPESLLVRPLNVFQVAFTPDRRSMIFYETIAPGNRDIWIARSDSANAARPLLRTPFNERAFALSPDGAWLAYVSNETGGDEVYVRGLADGSARWRVSTHGGAEPRWARGGRELVYRRADSLYSVTLTPGAEFRVGSPTALFGGTYMTLANQPGYDVTSDGNRFVMVRSQSASRGSEELHVVLHWFDQLQTRRP